MGTARERLSPTFGRGGPSPTSVDPAPPPPLAPAAAANPAADGRLLEGRLASAAAGAGAAVAAERGGEELTALAARLRREAEGLAMLAADQDAILAGAERAGALIRVLRAANLEDGELEVMLRVASRGLR